MTETFEQLVKYIRDQTEDDTIDDRIKDWLNDGLRQVTLKKRWLALTRFVTITPASGAVITVPPRMQTLNAIYESGNNVTDRRFRLREGERSDAQARYATNWYRTLGATLSGGSDITGLTVNQGDQTVTSTASSAPFVAGDVGKLMMLNASPQEFEIISFTDTDNIEVYPPYDKVDSTTEVGRIAPAGEQQYEMHAQDDSLFTTDVDMEYQMHHARLTLPQDRLLIPCARSISVWALIEANRNLKFDTDARALKVDDFVEALNDEFGSENREPRVSLPRGLNDSAPAFAVQARNRSRAQRRQRSVS